MTARQSRTKGLPEAEVSEKVAALVESLVDLVTTRVASQFPSFTSTPARAAYSVKEFAELLGTNRDRIYRDIGAGSLHSFRVGGEHRIPHSELERLTAVDRRTA